MISSNKRTSFYAINPVGDFLSPLWEGPTPTTYNYHQRNRNHPYSHHRRRQDTTSSASSWESLMNWMKERRSYRLFPQVFLHAKSSDPKLLLGVLACPLAPFPVFPRHHHQVQLIMPLCQKGITLVSLCFFLKLDLYIYAGVCVCMCA